MGSLGPKVSSSGQRKLWSDWADAQADLSLRGAHTHFVGFVTSWLNFVCVLNDTGTESKSLCTRYVFCFGSFCSHCRALRVCPERHWDLIITELCLAWKSGHVFSVRADSWSDFNWAGPWENVSYEICEQQRHRSAQSDQRLCCSMLR